MKQPILNVLITFCVLTTTFDPLTYALEFDIFEEKQKKNDGSISDGRTIHEQHEYSIDDEIVPRFAVNDAFSKLSNRAKEIIYVQILELTIFPMSNFDTELENNKKAVNAQRIDPSVNNIASVYREGIIAGYHFTLATRNDMTDWKKLLYSDCSEYDKTDAEFSSTLRNIGMGLNIAGITSDQYDYILTLKNERNVILTKGFIKGKDKAEELINQAINAARKNRSKHLRSDRIRSSNHDSDSNKERHAIPEIEALLFIRNMIEEKTEVDRKTFISIHSTSVTSAPVQREADKSGLNDNVQP